MEEFLTIKQKPNALCRLVYIFEQTKTKDNVQDLVMSRYKTYMYKTIEIRILFNHFLCLIFHLRLSLTNNLLLIPLEKCDVQNHHETYNSICFTKLVGRVNLLYMLCSTMNTTYNICQTYLKNNHCAENHDKEYYIAQYMYLWK